MSSAVTFPSAARIGVDAVGPDALEQLAGLGDLDERPRGAEAEAADALDLDVAESGLRGTARRGGAVMSWAWADMQLAASHT